MSSPLVSVKMITYNHAPYIAQAIDSVVGQKTDFPFELVIGEDCSTDGTREIVFEYRKKYPDIICVVTSEQNVGARLNGLRASEACHGTYIAFCEGDDYWHRTDKLQKQVDYMRSHPNCAMVYSDHDRYYVASAKRIPSWSRTNGFVQPPSPDMYAILFDENCHITTCTVMAVKTLIHQVTQADPILFQSGRFMMGDTSRWVELSRLGTVGYIDESLATRNILPESMTRSRDSRNVMRFAKSGCELYLYLIDKYDLPKEQQIRFQRRWQDCSLKLAFYERDAALAEEVRKQAGHLTLGQRIRYWGARNSVLHAVLAPTVRLLGRARRRLYRRAPV